MTRFLLELGQGWAFVGRQKELIISGKSRRIDLLFYHIRLRCYVVLELKAKPFEPEFAGKLNFYVNAIDAYLRDPSDNPTIGLLVCKGMDKTEGAMYIPVKIKEGKPSSAKSLASLEQFGKIFQKLDLITAEMGEELYSGKIEASPTKGAHDACEYCPYDSVCAYRMSEPRNTFSVDNAEVYAQLEKDLGGEEDA